MKEQCFILVGQVVNSQDRILGAFKHLETAKQMALYDLTCLHVFDPLNLDKLEWSPEYKEVPVLGEISIPYTYDDKQIQYRIKRSVYYI